MILVIAPAEHSRLVGAAEARHRLHQRVENRLKVHGGAADDLEYVGGRGLLLQRFAEIAVRSRNSLNSRVFSIAITAWSAKFVDQLDLLVGERLHLLADRS